MSYVLFHVLGSMISLALFRVENKYKFVTTNLSDDFKLELDWALWISLVFSWFIILLHTILVISALLVKYAKVPKFYNELAVWFYSEKL